MSESRKDVLLKALEAEAGVSSFDPGALFTDDVVGWSPYASVSGLTAVAELGALREMAFSNVVISLRGLDEVGNRAFAEWLIEGYGRGELLVTGLAERDSFVLDMCKLNEVLGRPPETYHFDDSAPATGSSTAARLAGAAVRL